MTVTTRTDPWIRRGGPAHLWYSYRQMLRFELTNLRNYLVVALVLQTLMGAGMGIMYGFYLGDLSPQAASFLVSGVPALALFPLGFVLVPGVISGQRIEDVYDYVWSLPVPRSASAGATFTVFTAISLPGTVVALLVSSLVYDVQLDPSWRIVPAVLLSASMATVVGYAVGQGMRNPRMVNLLTNLLTFVILMFSPIVIPIDLFPDWLAAVHRVLPFWHMTNLIRDGLTTGFVSDVGVSYAVSAVWTVGAVMVSARVVGRRR